MKRPEPNAALPRLTLQSMIRAPCLFRMPHIGIIPQLRSLHHMILDIEKAESGAPEGDRIGAPEIEITPQMVLAGKEEMTCVWIEFVHGPCREELWDEVLSKVFLAMWAAQSR